MSDQEVFEFEKGLERLEEIVRLLDGGELRLNESLALFEEGTRLARLCSLELSKAQGKLEMLIAKPDGSSELQDLEL